MVELKRRVYEPRGAALRLGRTRSREVLIEGGAGTGKTRAVLEYVVALCEQKPKLRVLLSRKTRKSMTESVLVTLETHVLGEGHPAITGTATRAHRDVYTFPNGSELILGGLDNTDRVMSTEFDVVAVFEATEASEDDWEKLSTRARNNVLPWQQLIADCNPAMSTHWLNVRAQSGRMERLLSRHEDNPSVTKEYLELLSNLTGVRRRRLYLHEWVSAEGLIWDVWDPQVHQVDMPSAEQLSEMVFIGGLDWGYLDAQVFQVWGQDPDGVLWRVAEVYRTGRNQEWWAGVIGRLHDRYNLRVIVADPSRPDAIDLLNSRLTPLGGRDVGQLVEKAMNRRVKSGSGDMGGLDMVRWMLRDEGGKSWVRVVRDAFPEGLDETLLEKHKARCLEEEIVEYVWATSLEGKQMREVPALGQSDHACDTLRYVCAWAYQRLMARRASKSEVGDDLGWKKVFMDSGRWIAGYGYDEQELVNQCWK